MDFDILQWLPQNARMSPSGWWSFNAPCCTYNGQSRADRRSRGGIITNEKGWTYHCFNCQFKTGHTYGLPLTDNAKKLLEWLGVDQKTIQQYVLENFQYRSHTDIIQTKRQNSQKKILDDLAFKSYPLPPGARRITKHDKQFVRYLEEERGLPIDSYQYYITPKTKSRNKNRLLIPFYFDSQVVGWISRYLDDKMPKYFTEHQQPGYLFGTELQKPESKYIFVVEGTFDAISIGGVATLHNDINKEQIAWLRKSGKEIVVVPDQDKSGLAIIQPALEAGFQISIPKWPENIKDVNDATKYYGYAGTLLSILSAKRNNEMRIKLDIMKRRKYAGNQH